MLGYKRGVLVHHQGWGKVLHFVKQPEFFTVLYFFKNNNKKNFVDTVDIHFTAPQLIVSGKLHTFVNSSGLSKYGICCD